MYSMMTPYFRMRPALALMGLCAVMLVGFAPITAVAQNPGEPDPAVDEVPPVGPGGVGEADSTTTGQPHNVLWLRASGVDATDGDPVGAWNDISGNDHDYSQGTSASRPIYRDGSNGINQTAVLNFDGTNDLLTDGDGNDYITRTDSLTAIYVVQSDKTNYDGGVFTTHVPDVHDTNAHTFRYDANGATSGSANTIKFAVTTNKTGDGSGDSDESETSEGVSTSNGTLILHSTSPRLYTASWRSGEFLDLFVNGYEETDLDRAGKGDGSSGGLSGTLDEQAGEAVRIGQGAKDGNNDGDPPGGHWDGDIAEVILYRDKLNTTQRRLVETYLQTRYAFGNFNDDLYSFDNSHPEAAGGIGRTSSSDFHLKGGSSIIELDAETKSNLSDGDFVVLGHNGQRLTYTTSERPNGGSNVQKVKREWKVDLTGASSQTVTVDVDLSSLSFPSGYNDFAVFVDDDGDFSNGATFYDLDSSGEVSGVSIEDAQYLTVASIKRTITYKNAASSNFEDKGGGSTGDAFSPDLNVELNYSSSTPITGIPYTVTEGTDPVLIEDTDNTFGNEGPGNQEDYRGDDGTFTLPAGTETENFNSGGSVIEVLNDGRDASSKSDENTAEDLEVALDTGNLPSSLTAGATTTHTFTINDDDDPRKVSFALGNSGEFKPRAILSTNPEESGSNLSGTNQEDEEDDVTTVSFEVGLPEGETGSPSTFATYEVTGADIDDFSIPANGSNQKISDRKGKVLINTTVQVDGPDAGTDKSDTGYGTFDIDINNDALHEASETLTVTLTRAESATLDPRAGADLDLAYTILNDDPLPEVEFTLASDSDDESTAGAVGTLQLSEAAGEELDVAFSVSGTATDGGVDYTQNTTSPVTFPVGDTKRDVSFSVTDDNVQEVNETIEVGIDYGSGDTDPAEPPSGNKTFSYTILDNDNIGPDGPGGVGDGEALQVWLDASAGVNQSAGGSPSSDGTPVGEWVDQGANEHDFTQSGSARPTLQTDAAAAINGRPVLQFDGNDDVLSDGDGPNQYINTESAFSAFSVASAAATGTDEGVFLADNDGGTGSDTDNTVMLRYRSGDNDLQFSINTNESGGGSQSFNSTNSIQSTNPQILQLDWSSGSDFSFYLNGASEGSAGSPRGGGLQNANTVLIGRSDNGSDAFWNGKIAETIFYTQTLNQAQRRIVTNYLAAKYGIIPNTDQYQGDTGFGIADGGDGNPSNGGDYDLAMIGVGQVNGELHGRGRLDGLDIQVKSGLDNGDFVTAGHRVADNSTTADGVSGLDGTSSNNQRSLRTWAVDWDDSGTTLKVDLTFDLSGLGFQGLAGDASNYKLIESGQDSTDTQSYSWSATSATASVSGSKITFSDVSLTSGNFYTLATTDNDASPLTSKTALVISGSEGNEGNANTTPSTYGGDAGWRLLGVPVQNGQAGDIFSGTDDPFVEFDLAGTKMMYTWDDTIDKGSDPDGNWSAAGSNTDIPNGRGFMVFLFDDEGTADADPIDPDLVLDVPDALSSPGDVDVDAGGLNTDAEYHLLANPYTVPYDLTSVVDGVSGIQSTVQIWDGNRSSGGTYLTATANGTTGQTESVTTGDVIAPWQGFFVQRSTVGSGPTTLTFNSAGRTTGSRDIIGSKAETQTQTGGATQLKLKLVTRDDQDSLLTRDRAASLYFHSGAASDWDTYDASKLFPMTASGDPWATIAPLGTGSDGTVEPKAVESRSKNVGTFEVPLELRASDGLSGTMTITAPVWRNVSDEWTFELVDTKGTSDPDDDVVHEFTPGGDGYSFSYDASQATSTSDTKAKAVQQDGRAPPALRTSGVAMTEPRTMEVDEKSKASAKDAAPSTRFKLRGSSGGAIPVEFGALDATVDDQDVVLEWTTISETNNQGFYVEHETEDSTQAFRKLGFVEGTGTTSEKQEYRYRIEELKVGKHTFRIRQVDVDGSASFSKTVTAKVRLDGPFALSESYPNPFRQTTTLDLSVREKQEVTVEVYDALGRRVEVLYDGIIEGNENRQLQFRGGDLSSGHYFIRVRGESFSAVRRAVLVK